MTTKFDSSMPQQPNALIAPSVLAADMSSLYDATLACARGGADWIHLDVMDGHFVPNITFGPPVVQCLTQHFQGQHPELQLFFDCHLMVSNPKKWLTAFQKAGVHQYTFHIEAVNLNAEAAHDLCQRIKDADMLCSVAVKPQTDVRYVFPLLEEPGLISNVLVMTVEPGFGGQTFMHDMMPKIKCLRDEFPISRLLNVQVDGGLNEDTTVTAAQHGSNVIVAGSSIFNSKDTKSAISRLKEVVRQNLSCAH